MRNITPATRKSQCLTVYVGPAPFPQWEERKNVDDEVSCYCCKAIDNSLLPLGLSPSLSGCVRARIATCLCYVTMVDAVIRSRLRREGWSKFNCDGPWGRRPREAAPPRLSLAMRCPRERYCRALAPPRDNTRCRIPVVCITVVRFVLCSGSGIRAFVRDLCVRVQQRKEK